MSSPAREREKAALRRVEDEAREQERLRKKNLSFWGRIEELPVDDELKSVLHRLAEAAGLE